MNNNNNSNINNDHQCHKLRLASISISSVNEPLYAQSLSLPKFGSVMETVIDGISFGLDFEYTFLFTNSTENGMSEFRSPSWGSGKIVGKSTQIHKSIRNGYNIESLNHHLPILQRMSLFGSSASINTVD